ncbi:MAG: HAD-IIB family hydrolase [Gammaproteobacteria bacterium]|nr:HAD-IIB family hydrolase [Gammaproteobacteria bacterium]
MNANARTLIFTDLDDTLIQTKRKLADHSHLLAGAVDREQKPLSYTTPPQRLLLQLLKTGGAILIPVTGRNQAAMDRVLLDDFHSYRIVSHGAMVLTEENQPCQTWLASQQHNHDLSAWAEHLDRLNETLNSYIKQQAFPIACHPITEAGMTAYLSIKADRLHYQESQLDYLMEHLKPQLKQGERWHRNGANLALLPPYTCKAKAVQFVTEQLQIHKHELVMGFGDSVSDLAFLRQTHFGLFPIGSQLDHWMGT